MTHISLLGGEALIALAEGFESRKDNVIKVVGQGDDLNKILNDEMLDSCDNITTRKTIRAIFLAVFAELCRRIDEILAAMQPFIDSYLTNNLDSTVMSNMKLYPATNLRPSAVTVVSPSMNFDPFSVLTT